jgi:FixJ family two-component response regulator
MNEFGQCRVVYVVDDDELVRSALTALFRTYGYEVLAFSSADEFLDQFKSSTDGFLITDYQMPGTNGVDLIEELCRRDSLTPSVLYTGSAHIVDLKQIESELPCVIVEKPCAFDELREAMVRASEVIKKHASGRCQR